VVLWLLYVNHILTVAHRHVNRAQRCLEHAELSGDWRDYHRAQFAFKRAARLYLRANQYPSGRWFAVRSVEMRRQVEKYI